MKEIINEFRKDCIDEETWFIYATMSKEVIEVVITKAYKKWFHKGYDEWFNAKSDIDSNN